MAAKLSNATTIDLDAEENLQEADEKSLDEMEANDGEDNDDADKSAETVEVFKVEVRNLPFFGIAEMKRVMLKKFGIEVSRVKSPKRRDLAYLWLQNQADQEKAVQSLDGYQWKKRELSASLIAASREPVKRPHEDKDPRPRSKRPRTITDATCPLISMPYEEQLKKKAYEIRKIFKEFGTRLCKLNSKAKSLLKYTDNVIPCEFLGVKPSPKLEGYRNKSDFAVGKNAQGEILVGFRVGDSVDGCVEVDSIQDLPQIPEKARKGARVFEEFIKQSKFEPYKPLFQSGHFKQLSVRTSQTTDEVMLICGIFSSNLTEDEIKEIKSDLKKFFDNYDRNDFVCTSLYYQDLITRKQGHAEDSVEHLSGATHIHDEIHGLKFRISPLAFFPLNTSAAEVLYDQAIELVAPKPHSTVLDICCGIGTIGSYFAKRCKQVIGVEIIPDVVKDAEYNARANNIKNYDFRCGNVDYYLDSLTEEVVYEAPDKNELDLIAVIDPTRDGIGDRATAALRRETELKRLVYIASNPRRVMRDLVNLGKSETTFFQGSPLLPTKAVAVDMFPHTPFFQLIILFERVDDDEKSDDLVNSDVKNDEDKDESVVAGDTDE